VRSLCVMSYNVMMQAYIALSDVDAAAECFEKALKLAPNDGRSSVPPSLLPSPPSLSLACMQ